jgi:uncharacterized membrane protein (DUF4010 family)
VSFLLIVCVILPVLPDQGYAPFDLNPRRTWMVVVAVSGLSYASYVAQKLVRARGNVLLTALLGGAYSSTATTLVLARRSREQPDVPATYAGAIVLASGVMYVRMGVLVLLFAPPLAEALVPRASRSSRSPVSRPRSPSAEACHLEDRFECAGGFATCLDPR